MKKIEAIVRPHLLEAVKDALQTLGTFISSNQKLPWWALFLFAAVVLVIVRFFGRRHAGGLQRRGGLACAARPRPGAAGQHRRPRHVGVATATVPTGGGP